MAEPTANDSFLLVDGHSVIYAWSDLRAIHEDSPRRAREELILRLTSYQDTSGERVVLVYDGRGGKSESVGDPRGVQVIYSKDGATADQLIERLAAKYAGKCRLTVATRDRAILDLVSTYGALCISPVSLLELVAAQRKSLDRRLGRRTR